MAELKTKKTKASVTTFLDKVTDQQRRKDCQTVLNLMKQATGAEPRMWGSSIVGFGTYHYRYASGREGEWAPHWVLAAQDGFDALHHAWLRKIRIIDGQAR